jgi:hypothetical protein
LRILSQKQQAANEFQRVHAACKRHAQSASQSSTATDGLFLERGI